MSKSSQSLKQKAWHEMKEFLVIALYLWLVLGLFTVYKAVILAEEHISFVYQGFAIINALALGKIILIGRALHLGDQFNDAPLIYPTLLKSTLFTVVLACFKVLEEVLVGLYRGKSFHESITTIGGGTWTAFVTLTALMFVVLIPFFAFSELQRILGEGKLAQIFFRHQSSSKAAYTGS